jgi:N-acetylmuramoyl-L-alanine amidase
MECPMFSKLPSIAHECFLGLTDVYTKTVIEYPKLRSVTLAQWGLESGYGKSDLAIKHHNYAGMKWRQSMVPYGYPAPYKAHDGQEFYVHFRDDAHFIAGYWKRLDMISNYDGWRAHTKTPEDFIGFIGPIWLGLSAKENAEYVANVLRIKTTIMDKEFSY